MTAQVANFSLYRVGAMVLRHWYLLRSSWPRLLELVYWPAVQMFMWGFLQLGVGKLPGALAGTVSTFLAAFLLWDILFRGQIGYSISFLEEMWSRNLGHLFVSPLRPYELVISLVLMSLIRTLIGVGGAALIAILLFNYNIFDMGLPLLSFFLNLIVMGWAIGLLVAGIVLRYGLGAESVAWVAVFAIQPISAIYYPVSVLPEWLQPVAWCLPSSYVFEGMRELLFEQTFNTTLLWQSMALNLLYLIGGISAFLAFFRAARQRGLLLQVGE